MSLEQLRQVPMTEPVYLSKVETYAMSETTAVCRQGLRKGIPQVQPSKGNTSLNLVQHWRMIDLDQQGKYGA